MLAQKYPSKLNKPLWIAVYVVLGVIIILVAKDEAWLAVGLLVFTGWFVGQTIFNTHYTITGQELIIKSGLLYHRTIDIGSIRKLSKSDSVQSSPAASFDRIEIAFNKSDEVLISPENRADFVKRLIEINPAITLDSKLLN